VVPGGADVFVFLTEDLLPVGGDGVGEQLQLVHARDDVLFDRSDLVDEAVVGTPLAARVGEFLFVAWRKSPPAAGASSSVEHRAALVGLDGALRGGPFSISLEGRRGAVLEQLAAGPNGVLWTLWRDGSDVLLALFDADRAADSSAAPALVAGGDSRQELLTVNDGQVLVAWLEGSEPRVRGQLFEDCASGPGQGELPLLCLNGGRYTAQLEWELEDGRNGVGFPSPARTPDSGIFYFFNPENWEMMVKVLDGCHINGHHWVFAAPTTGLGFTLVVEETASGSTRTYENTPGILPTVIADTGAFPCEP